MSDSAASTAGSRGRDKLRVEVQRGSGEASYALCGCDVVAGASGLRLLVELVLRRAPGLRVCSADDDATAALVAGGQPLATSSLRLDPLAQ